MKVIDLLSSAVEQNASDIFLVPGMPFSYKLGSRIVCQNEEKLFPAQMETLITELYELAGNRSMEKVREHGDDDFSFALPGVSRFRSSVFRQRGSLAAVIRVVTFDLPDYETLHIPQNIIDIAQLTKGFVLVTGPAGSGKSTTLACIIDKINHTRNAHVITLEDPIEYLHRHKKSVVTQREIVTDTDSYVSGLRAALRQAPDVILVGEMRDYETIQIAMTAAETGHLVISTLHTVGAANTIDRIIDNFPPNQQQQIRMQISMVMQAVVSQQLIPTVDGGVYPAFEIMFFNNAIRNMIRESKTHQIDSVIATGQSEGMVSMDTISTLHTVGAANTIDRIIDNFPPNQQQQIRMQISMVMQAVVSQQLIPTVDGGVYPAFEIMFFNNAIRNMIRESKTHQIDSVIATGQSEGMVSMDTSLLNLYKKGMITKESAVIYSSNGELMAKKIERQG
ncbi:hypothetical protein K170097C1_15390 [Hungatella effluvii]|uniref:type IV pilus twitching motility protein PilT n=1 Tax=Hungatella effluvii TaxID=1096246 RepID=UPI0034C382D9